jgi:hypothetical protein
VIAVTAAGAAAAGRAVHAESAMTSRIRPARYKGVPDSSGATRAIVDFLGAVAYLAAA